MMSWPTVVASCPREGGREREDFAKLFFTPNDDEHRSSFAKQGTDQ